MKFVRRVALALLSVLTVAHAAPLLPTAPNPVSVLSSLPVTHYLATSLANGTAISAHFVGPDTGGLDDHARYLEASDEFARLARDADAVITVRGAWPVDPLFPATRAINIRIVEIDAVAPVEAGRVGVGLRHEPGDGGETVPFVREVWTSPSNVAKMADIVAADLARISPADAEMIQHNLSEIKAPLFALRTEAQRALTTVEIPEAVSLAVPFVYLCQDLGIHIDAWFVTDPYRWDKAERQRFLDAAEQVPVVISAYRLDDDLAGAVKERNAVLAVLNPLTQRGSTGEPFVDTLANNISTLLDALR